MMRTLSLIFTEQELERQCQENVKGKESENPYRHVVRIAPAVGCPCGNFGDTWAPLKR